MLSTGARITAQIDAPDRRSAAGSPLQTNVGPGTGVRVAQEPELRTGALGVLASTTVRYNGSPSGSQNSPSFSKAPSGFTHLRRRWVPAAFDYRKRSLTFSPAFLTFDLA
jgi:hypothetical protein